MKALNPLLAAELLADFTASAEELVAVGDV
jgi:hypothetical protein